jgi:hypothetical protein
LYGLDGYAVPFFYKDNTSTKCLVGSISGNLWHYSVPSNPLTNFILLSKNEDGLNEGAQSTPLYEDLNADGKRDLILGNGSGGLTYFSSSSPFVGVDKYDVNAFSNQISIFPNPSSDIFNLRITARNFSEGTVTICDVSGRVLTSFVPLNELETINMTAFQNGLYFITVSCVMEDVPLSSTKIIVKN